MIQGVQKYLNAFNKLRIDRSHGIAPHKPILLISILQAVQQGLITTNRIFLSPELIALFRSNWNMLVYTHHDCRISYPFYFMKSEKFWTLIPREDNMDFTRLDSLVKNINRLNSVIDYALLDAELFERMLDHHQNNVLMQFLMDQYFPNSNKQVMDFSPNGVFKEIENKILTEAPHEYRNEIKQLLIEKNDEEIFLRGSIFKREIPKIYNNTCCISGMRVDSTKDISMIDACHIVPFSESFDDTITNGFTLCPKLHRAFDRGLIAIDENYRVLISNNFNEKESIYGIRIFEGKEIILPRIESYYPLKTNFKKHREEKYCK